MTRNFEADGSPRIVNVVEHVGLQKIGDERFWVLGEKVTNKPTKVLYSLNILCCAFLFVGRVQKKDTWFLPMIYRWFFRVEESIFVPHVPRNPLSDAKSAVPVIQSMLEFVETTLPTLLGHFFLAMASVAIMTHSSLISRIRSATPIFCFHQPTCDGKSSIAQMALSFMGLSVGQRKGI